MKKIVTLDEFIGQSKTIETLKISIAAAKKRQETMGHILLTGPISSGRHTLANAIANELNAPTKRIDLKEFLKVGDLIKEITGLSEGSVLIIEEIDEIKQDFVNSLCSAMEDDEIDFIIGKPPYSRMVNIPLPTFTLIGIASSKHKLPNKLMQRFYIDAKFTEYSEQELFELAKKWCLLNNSNITDEAAAKIAVYSDGSSKLLHSAVKRARDFADVYSNGIINCDIVDKTLANLSDKDFMLTEERN